MQYKMLIGTTHGAGVLQRDNKHSFIGPMKGFVFTTDGIVWVTAHVAKKVSKETIQAPKSRQPQLPQQKQRQSAQNVKTSNKRIVQVQEEEEEEEEEEEYTDGTATQSDMTEGDQSEATEGDQSEFGDEGQSQYGEDQS